MRRITGADELRQIRAAGRGFLFNDSPRAGVLHAASCDRLGRAGLTHDKYFAGDLGEAEGWLKVRRGAHWQRCAYCLPPHP